MDTTRIVYPPIGPIERAVGQRRKMRGLGRHWRRNPTKAEAHLQVALQNDPRFEKISWMRQKAAIRFLLDFYFPKKQLFVELDGANHDTEQGKFKDEVRSYDLRRAGYVEMRFTNEEALNNTQAVLDKIHAKYESLEEAVRYSPRQEELMKEKSRSSFIKPS